MSRKTIVLVRGEDPARDVLAHHILNEVNTGKETIVADFVSVPSHDPIDAGSAYSTCKNSYKRALLYSRPIIIVSNPFRSPRDWKSYITLARKHTDMSFRFVGVQASYGLPRDFAEDVDRLFCLSHSMQEVVDDLLKG